MFHMVRFKWVFRRQLTALYTYLVSCITWTSMSAVRERTLNLITHSLSMITFSALLAICAGNSPVTGEFPTQRPVTRSFDFYFDLRPNERLNKQS